MPGKAAPVVYAVLFCVASLSAVYICDEQNPEWLHDLVVLLCPVTTSAMIGLVLFCLESIRMDALEHCMDEQFRNTNEQVRNTHDMLMIIMTEEQKKVYHAQQVLRAQQELRAAQRDATNETAQSALSVPHGGALLRAAAIDFGVSSEKKEW
jgi:hypothetical protein